jgi:TnpA family transposase
MPRSTKPWKINLAALGLVLNVLVLFTSRYLNAASTELRARGYEVRDEDTARLPPFVRHTSTCSAATRS